MTPWAAFLPRILWPSRGGVAILMPDMGSQAATTEDALIRELTISNRMGIHARPAALFVKTAAKFRSDIFVEKDGERINGKSIMGLMMLAAGPGCRLHVEVTGADAPDAMAAIEELVCRRKFDEE